MAVSNDGAGWGSREDAYHVSPADDERAKDLLSYLQRAAVGEGSAKTVTELARAVGVNERKIRTLVTHLRAGRRLPVLATPDAGYFWPRSRAEAEHTLAFLAARIASTADVRRGIEEGLVDLFEGAQSTLFGE